jgi:hypothetical protein
MYAASSCAAAGGARSRRFRRKATLIASGSSQAIICRLAEQIDYYLGQKARFLVAQRLHRKSWRCTHGKGRCSRSESVGTVLGAYLAGHMTPAPKRSRELADGKSVPSHQNAVSLSGASPLKVATCIFPWAKAGSPLFREFLLDPIANFK